MLFFICVSVIVGLLSCLLLILYMFVTTPKPIDIRNSHVIVTGGSSGIGKALAGQALQNGARVTLVARDQVKLKQAKQELAAQVPDGRDKVQTLSVDLTLDFNDVKNKFDECQTTFGPISILFNCAGGANPGKFDEVPLSDFQKMININYISAIHATRAVLPTMKEKNRGRIVFTSSQAGQLGLFGFTAYSASKFALRGVAESLQMEVKPYNISLTLAFPPDTDTPGLAQEEKSKPEETRLISETAGLFSADHVANIILKDTLCGRFFCSVGVDGLMLSNLTSGFSPVTSVLDALFQVTSMGIFRVISLFYLHSFDKIVKSCKLKRELNQECVQTMNDKYDLSESKSKKKD